MKRNIEREKVYDFIKNMQDICSIKHEFACIDEDDKDMYFQGVKFVLRNLWFNDLIRFSELKKIEDVIDQCK